MCPKRASCRWRSWCSHLSRPIGRTFDPRRKTRDARAIDPRESGLRTAWRPQALRASAAGAAAPRSAANFAERCWRPSINTCLSRTGADWFAPCDACAILFDRPSNAPYRRVPRRGRFLVNFLLADELWNEFSIPINVAFFFYSTPANRILAIYPSPAGPTESLLPLSAWETLAATNPLVETMQPDVEALLVNRLGNRLGFVANEYYLAPIDACYQLIGLIRLHWRGLGGGAEVWQEIAQFFAQFQSQCLRDVRD